MNNNNNNNIRNMVNYKCEKCHKVFNQKIDYERHTKRKIPCVNNDKDKNHKTENIMEKLNTLIKTVHNLEQEVKELKNKNNIEVNGDVNINCQVNCQVNIIAFGKEDLSYLSIDQIKTILKQGLKGPEKYVEMIHCNKDKLEYKNIYISNRKNKDNSIMMYDGNGWKLCDSSCIDRLRDKGIEFMEEKYEEIKDQLPPNIKKMMDRFNVHMDGDDSDNLKNDMSKNIKITLYNNRPDQSKQSTKN
jgi:uncharacterized C2H2 Zn-finger protein